MADDRGRTPPAAAPATPTGVAGQVAGVGDAISRALGYPTRWLTDRLDFANDRYENRRLFSELLGTFFLVLVAVGGGMVNARFGGDTIPLAAQVTAPGLMVGAIILFMGSVSGAHLNPAVTLAFAVRGDFPWKRAPGYILAQFLGAAIATLLLGALIGGQGMAGLSAPGPGISPLTAMWWEALLTVGLVSTILGTSSGAQQLGPLAAIGVASYIALAGLWGAPVSGASMNPARSIGPALATGQLASWWVYLVGPVLGALIAVGCAFLLRGPGGGFYGAKAAQGGLGWLWHPGAIDHIVADNPKLARELGLPVAPPGPERPPSSGPTGP